MTGRARSAAPVRGAVALRPATPGDCAAVWRWRNEEETRRASFDPAVIPFEAHRAWYLDALGRPDRRLYIVSEAGEPCGVVRLDLAPPQGTVSMFLTRARQGRGIGGEALRAVAGVAARDLGLVRLLALVKPDNPRSLAAFGRAGFAVSEASPRAVTLVKALGAEP